MRHIPLRKELEKNLLSSDIPDSHLKKASFELLEIYNAYKEGHLESDMLDVIVHGVGAYSEANEVGISYQTVKASDFIGLIAKDEIQFVEANYGGELELEVSANSIGVKTFINETGLTGRGVIVAVLDDEVAQHSDFGNRIAHKSSHSNLPWGKHNFLSSPQHATMIAGIIAGSGATSPSNSLVGIAPEATIWNYRIWPEVKSSSGNFTTRGVVDAIIAAVKDGAHIINLSYGKKVMELNGMSDLCKAVNYAFNEGVLVVKSSGNKGRETPPNITSPADSPNCLTVGMTSNDGSRIMPGSSFGKTTFGLNRPDLVAPGASINGPSTDDNYIVSDADGFLGTSFAAPHITGAGALLLQAKPDQSPSNLKNLLIDSCLPLDSEPSKIQGRGLLRLDSLIGHI